MNNIGLYIDLAFVVVILFGAISGYRDGIVVSLISLASILFTIFFYSTFSNIIANKISPWVENKQMLPYMTAAIMFICLSVFSWGIGRLVRMYLNTTPLGLLDRAFGSALGGVKWIFFFGVLTWMIGASSNTLKNNYLNHSYSFKFLEPKIDLVITKITKGNNSLEKQASNNTPMRTRKRIIKKTRKRQAKSNKNQVNIS